MVLGADHDTYPHNHMHAYSYSGDCLAACHCLAPVYAAIVYCQVMAMEAESEAVGVLVAGDGLESKFAQLESGTVEDELAALKKGMLGAGKGEQGAAPSWLKCNRIAASILGA